MPRFLLRDLAITGARTDDDAPVASGFVTAYQPGTTTLAVVYVDATTDEAQAQPILLDETGRATLWVDAPVRLLIQAANGTTVFDGDPADTTAAKAVTLENTGWPDSADTDAAFTKLATSLGGFDGNFRPDPAAIDLLLKDWLNGLCVSVKSWGAKGDGLADDGPAITSAYTQVAQHTVLGGIGTLFFPPGVYKMGAPLSILDSGIRVLGSGRDATILRFFAADSDGVIVKTPAQVAHFTIDFAGASLGTGLTITDAPRTRIDKVSIAGVAAADGFRFGIRFTSPTIANNGVVLDDCRVRVNEDDLSVALVVKASDNLAVVDGLSDLRVLGGSYDVVNTGGPAGRAMDIQIARGVTIDAVAFSSGTRAIDLGYTDTPSAGTVVEGVTVKDCDFTQRASGEDLKVSSQCDYTRTDNNLWKTGVNDEHAITDPGKNNIYTDLSQNPVFNGGQIRVFAAPATFTPDLDKGTFFKLTANPGVAVTIAAPTSFGFKRPGQQISFELAGDGTAFTFNAIYVGFSSGVRRIQTGTWDGTNWVANTPKESGLQILSAATGGSVTPVVGGVVEITCTGGGAGDVNINAPTGTAITGDRMTFILHGHDDLTNWEWDADYHETARYADETASGLVFIAASKTGAVGVVAFVYDGAGWALEGAARDGTGAGQHPPYIDTQPVTAPADVNPDRAFTDISHIRVSGGVGSAAITLKPPFGSEFTGSRLRLILEIVGIVDLGSWILDPIYTLPDGETPTTAFGWPLVAGKMGVIDFMFYSGEWRKVNASGVMGV